MSVLRHLLHRLGRHPIARITTIEGRRHYTPRPGQTPQEYAAERDALLTHREPASAPAYGTNGASAGDVSSDAGQNVQRAMRGSE